MNITARRIARAPMTPRNALPDFEDSESFSLRPSDVSGGSLTYQKSSWSPPHPSIDPDIWSVSPLSPRSPRIYPARETWSVRDWT